MTNPMMAAWLRAMNETASESRVSITTEMGRQQADLVKVWLDAWIDLTFPWLPGEASGAKRKA